MVDRVGILMDTDTRMDMIESSSVINVISSESSANSTIANTIMNTRASNETNVLLQSSSSNTTVAVPTSIVLPKSTDHPIDVANAINQTKMINQLTDQTANSFYTTDNRGRLHGSITSSVPPSKPNQPPPPSRVNVHSNNKTTNKSYGNVLTKGPFTPRFSKGITRQDIALTAFNETVETLSAQIKIRMEQPTLNGIKATIIHLQVSETFTTNTEIVIAYQNGSFSENHNIPMSIINDIQTLTESHNKVIEQHVLQGNHIAIIPNGQCVVSVLMTFHQNHKQIDVQKMIEYGMSDMRHMGGTHMYNAKDNKAVIQQMAKNPSHTGVDTTGDTPITAILVAAGLMTSIAYNSGIAILRLKASQRSVTFTMDTKGAVIQPSDIQLIVDSAVKDLKVVHMARDSSIMTITASLNPKSETKFTIGESFNASFTRRLFLSSEIRTIKLVVESCDQTIRAVHLNMSALSITSQDVVYVNNDHLVSTDMIPTSDVPKTPNLNPTLDDDLLVSTNMIPTQASGDVSEISMEFFNPTKDMNQDPTNTNTPPPADTMAENPTGSSDSSQFKMDVDVPDTNSGTKRFLVDDGPFTIVENRKKKGTHKPPINPGFSNKTHPKRRFTETSKILPDPPQANRYISLQAGSAEASDHSDDQ